MVLMKYAHSKHSKLLIHYFRIISAYFIPSNIIYCWLQFDKMNYSELVTALQENDSSKINELIEAFIPRLMAFLRVHLNADYADAQDCAQETLLITIETIQEDKLRKPEKVTAFMLSTCRNTYLKMQGKNREYVNENLPEQHYAAPQLQSLLDEERGRLLRWCLKQLNKKYQEFIRYWFDHPDEAAITVAEHFNISVNNAWTRKHRIIKKLNECYENKSKK